MIPNKFGGFCAQCRGWIGAGDGFLDGKDPDTGRWRITCHACTAEAATSYRFDARVEADPPPHWRDDPIIAARLRQLEIEGRQAWERIKAREHEEQMESIRRWIEQEEAWRRAELARPRCLAILGLDPPVTRDTLRRRFRELALRHHPDHGGSASRFMEIRAAYDQAMPLAMEVAG